MAEIAMSRRLTTTLIVVCMSLIAQDSAQCQPSQKSISNDDVIAMVEKKLPESVIISAIRSGPSRFDTTTNGLIRLNAAGVTENELNAMVAASTKTFASSASGTSTHTSDVNQPSTPTSKWQMPTVTVTQGSSSQELKLEKTQLTETKNKPASMTSLAGDPEINYAIEVGADRAAYGAATHMNSSVGGSLVESAGGIFSSAMVHRIPNVTYVWGVPSPVSTNVLQSTTPKFRVDFSRAPGINPEEYAPAIVRLTPARNNCRIVGASQGKADVRSSAAADWQVYSHYLEEQVATNPQKFAPGKYTITFQEDLVPGEYGLVLRPISKSKKFSGGEVARAQGDGLMFDAIWTFQISEEAK
jgi:hypothetical protein